MEKRICVFCSSSDAIDAVYFNDAQNLGKIIGVRHYQLIHGGGKIGLMGVIARTVQQFGGTVMGIIPEKLNMIGIASETDDQLVVTKDMQERKAVMRDNSDVFIALPGGFGTLEEVMEVITLKQLRYHSCPIIFINTNNFYGKLLDQFEVFYQQDFAKPNYRKLYFVANNIDQAIDYIDNYQPETIEDKWFK